MFKSNYKAYLFLLYYIIVDYLKLIFFSSKKPIVLHLASYFLVNYNIENLSILITFIN